MDYFRILNLKREPFSNSPDPEIFYPSRNHVECLHRLEMAIRLRRGLNVVLGEVGTGKTTLCRKLIQQISVESHPEDGKGCANAIELHLVMDPSFSSSHEFLSVIATYFGLIPAGSNMTDWTEWRLKEAIKNHLFAKGVEEGKVVVLLIDEGQKLPDFCLEILREFLNYETNDSKLLQIVIFAQKEFRETIYKHANFSNRINLCFPLTPLGFRETCLMVSFRINESSDNGEKRRMFTWPGLLALYKATRGYPRSINMLCHQVILGLIIQNRMKAGWSLVRACARRLGPERRRPVNLRLAILSTMLAVVLSFLVFTYHDLFKAAPAKKDHFTPPANALNALMYHDQPLFAAPKEEHLAALADAIKKQSTKKTAAPKMGKPHRKADRKDLIRRPAPLPQNTWVPTALDDDGNIRQDPEAIP